MRLDRVDIRNYRSIKNLTIKFNKNCVILIGANESGKSNILRALSLLKKDSTNTIDDLRDPLPEEKPEPEKYVRFIFRLDSSEINELFIYASKYFYGVDEKFPLMNTQSKSLTLRDFCNIVNEGLLTVDLESRNKRRSYWSISGYELNKSIKRLSPPPPDKISSVLTFNDEIVTLKDIKYINVESVKELYSVDLSDTDLNEINKDLGSFILELVLQKLPRTIFWEYTDNNLLPGRIDLNQFKENPDVCIPLKNIFLLAGINNINKAITEAESKKNGMRNLLNRVAKITSKHINTAWKETKDISLSLAQNGNFIEAGIQDAYNIYDFARRSEGFKRFVTFLLMISAEERNQQLSNALILIDEPDLGLHPSGIRNLREELLKISSSNTVVISTHSINMIDREHIDMHKIVKKENEITVINEVRNSELTDDEVLYNALGFSLFEMLNKNNIIFEGWRDKEFFKKSLTKFKRHDDFKNIGYCHAAGTKDIESKGGLVELLGRDFLILSDSDKPALEKKKLSGYKEKWLMYADICGSSFETMEDFINLDYLTKKFNASLKEHKKEELNGVSLNPSMPIMGQFKNLLLSQETNKEVGGTILNSFKELALTGLRSKDIKDDFSKVLDKILACRK